MQTRVASRLERVITVSRSSYDDICRDHQVSPERLFIVPVGVDPDLFVPMPEVRRSSTQIISTASSDVAMKGQRYLLEALAKLRADHPDVRLVMVGKLKDGSAAQRTIEQLGLSDAVEFVSGISDERLVEMYNESACAVVPSLYEGFSLPAIEAMSTGCPLVATSGGAIPEVAGADGETCYMTVPGDSESLAAGIRRAIEDPAGAERIGRAGRERVIERWSWRHTAERTVEHYRATALPPHPPRRRADRRLRRVGHAPGRARARPRRRRRPALLRVRPPRRAGGRPRLRLRRVGRRT